MCILTVCLSYIRHFRIRMHLAQVRLVSLRCRLDGLISRIPIGRANLIRISLPAI